MVVARAWGGIQRCSREEDSVYFVPCRDLGVPGETVGVSEGLGARVEWYLCLVERGLTWDYSYRSIYL